MQDLHCLTPNLLSNYHLIRNESLGYYLQVITAVQGNKYCFPAKKKDSSSEPEYPARLRLFFFFLYIFFSVLMPAEQTGTKSRT